MARVLVVIDRSSWRSGIEALARPTTDRSADAQRRELLDFLFKLDALVRRLVEEDPAPTCRRRFAA